VTEIDATPRLASPAFGLARLAALPLERMSELGLSYTSRRTRRSGCVSASSVTCGISVSSGA
jgi:hypothetical protein